MPQEVEKEDNNSNREITDDGNYSRPTGTVGRSSVFITRYEFFMNDIVRLLKFQNNIV